MLCQGINPYVSTRWCLEILLQKHHDLSILKYHLTDGYHISGYKAYQTVLGITGDSEARVIHMKRLQKKHDVQPVVKYTGPIMIRRSGSSGICPVETLKSIFNSNIAGASVKNTVL